MREEARPGVFFPDWRGLSPDEQAAQAQASRQRTGEELPQGPGIPTGWRGHPDAGRAPAPAERMRAQVVASNASPVMVGGQSAEGALARAHARLGRLEELAEEARHHLELLEAGGD